METKDSSLQIMLHQVSEVTDVTVIKSFNKVSKNINQTAT